MSEKLHTRAMPEGQTRNCIYPWTDVEIQDNGDIRPCCARKPVGNLTNASLAKILNGDEMRKLRSSLLSGNLDHTCMNCRLQPSGAKSDLIERVRALRHEVGVPPDFDVAEYLAANPDVANSGIDPIQHYLQMGRLEGRRLRPKSDVSSPFS
jgi:radical SAM protein with 4Fe4S-binding SPASM domain